MTMRSDEMSKSEQLEEMKNTLIGRLLTLGGSALFLIFTLIVTILTYQDYAKLLSSEK